MTDSNDQELARFVLEQLDDERIVLAIPHTEYRLHLKPSVPAGEIDVKVGRRVRGVVQAKALRIHPARGGGSFIEPIWGEPRIVAGKVMAIDVTRRRVLVDAGIPMWVTAPPGQDLAALGEGELVNFYVESGASFRPVISAA